MGGAMERIVLEVEVLETKLISPGNSQDFRLLLDCRHGHCKSFAGLFEKIFPSEKEEGESAYSGGCFAFRGKSFSSPSWSEWQDVLDWIGEKMDDIWESAPSPGTVLELDVSPWLLPKDFWECQSASMRDMTVMLKAFLLQDEPHSEKDVQTKWEMSMLRKKSEMESASLKDGVGSENRLPTCKNKDSI